MRGLSLDKNVEPMMFESGSENQSKYFKNNIWDGLVVGSYDRVEGDANRRLIRFITEMGKFDIQNPEAAYSDIKSHGGCSLPSRDATDTAFLAERDEVDAGTTDGTFGIVEFVSNNPVFTPFAPGGTGGNPYADADDDGMDDAWESSNMKPIQSHLDYHPWDDADGDGWTNLEEFLNKTNPRYGDDPLTLEFKLF